MSQTKGVLYVVATPIGNLDDMTHRAVQVLKDVALIAAEDTRVTHKLLQHFQIDTPKLSLHAHNEEKQGERILEMLQQHHSVALVSDAGTPLISDPGAKLVSAVLDAGFTVTPIPGCSAVMTALSASGLPAQPFLFMGFLSSTKSEREKQLKRLTKLPFTLVFFEAPHRLKGFLESCSKVFGSLRQGVVARELTKWYESFYRGSLDELLQQMQMGTLPAKGECVVLVGGSQGDTEETTTLDADLLLKELLAVLPATSAAKIVARLTGQPRQAIYKKALNISM